MILSPLAPTLLVGLGLGVWQVAEEQGRLMMDVYASVLKDNKLSHISDMNFSYFPPGSILTRV